MKDDIVKIIPALVKKAKVIYNPVINEDLFKKSNIFVNHKFFDDTGICTLINVGRFEQQKKSQNVTQGF